MGWRQTFLLYLKCSFLKYHWSEHLFYFPIFTSVLDWRLYVFNFIQRFIFVTTLSWHNNHALYLHWILKFLLNISMLVCIDELEYQSALQINYVQNLPLINSIVWNFKTFRGESNDTVQYSCRCWHIISASIQTSISVAITNVNICKSFSLLLSYFQILLQCLLNTKLISCQR